MGFDHNRPYGREQIFIGTVIKWMEKYFYGTNILLWEREDAE